MAERDMETTAKGKAAGRWKKNPKAGDQRKERAESEDDRLGQGAQPAGFGAIIGLQQTQGNAYVQRLLASRAVQGKLTVNPPNDQYEREADAVGAAFARTAGSPVQRQELPEEEEEEEIQAKAEAGSPVQRQELPEEEEEIQAKAAGGSVPRISEDLEDRINAARASGQTLPDSLRSSIEPELGHDFSRVRLHTNAEADVLSRQLGAKAFTTGKDVFFRQGDYQPDTEEGRGLIGHELTHVVQQGEAKALPGLAREPASVKRRSGATTAVQAQREVAAMAPDTATTVPPDKTFEQLKKEAESAADDGRLGKAIQIFERMLLVPGRTAAEYGECHGEIGELNFKMGRYATCIVYLERALKAPNDLPEGVYEKGEKLLRKAKKALGIPKGEGQGLSPEEAAAKAEEFKTRAVKAESAGRYGLAITVYERIRQFPGISDKLRAEVTLGMGRCNWLLQRDATAIIYLESCVGSLELSADDRARARSWMAECKRRIGVPEAGVPENSRDLYRNAKAAYDARDFEKAYELFERVLLQQPKGIGPIVVAMLFNMGMCMFRRQRYWRALHCFDEALKTPGGDEAAKARVTKRANEVRQKMNMLGTAKSFFDAAQVAFAAGDFAKAHELFERAYQTIPFPAFLWNMGMCMMALKRYPEAIRCFEEYSKKEGAQSEAEASKKVDECRRKMAEKTATATEG
jgi:tetratricopeptide (TPR) repeat protein